VTFLNEASYYDDTEFSYFAESNTVCASPDLLIVTTLRNSIKIFGAVGEYMSRRAGENYL
jgi:hypothetical protein